MRTETIIVKGGKAELAERPDRRPVRIFGFRQSRVDKDQLAADQFFVSYSTGQIFFNTAAEGKSLKAMYSNNDAKASTPEAVAQTAADVEAVETRVSALESRTLDDTRGGLSVGKGGTGSSTNVGAFKNLSPAVSKGDLIVCDGDTNVKVPVGNNGQFLAADSQADEGVSWQYPLVPQFATEDFTFTGNLLTATDKTFTPANAPTVLISGYLFTVLTSLFPAANFTIIKAADETAAVAAGVTFISQSSDTMIRMYIPTGLLAAVGYRLTLTYAY